LHVHYQISYRVIEAKRLLLQFDGLFYLFNIDTDEENSTKKIVQNLAQNYADKWISKPMLYKLNRRLPIDIPTPSKFLQRKS
jgi:hypothetical protein